MPSESNMASTILAAALAIKMTTLCLPFWFKASRRGERLVGSIEFFYGRRTIGGTLRARFASHRVPQKSAWAMLALAGRKAEALALRW
jgi:hypothetical protein